MPDMRRPGHLPNLRAGGEPPRPDWLPRQRKGTSPQMIGRFPDYDVLESASDWDGATREVVMARLAPATELSFFSQEQAPTLRAFCDVVLAQDLEPRVPVVELVDEKLAAGRLDGYQYEDMPDDRDTWRSVLEGLDHTAGELHGRRRSPTAPPRISRASSKASPLAGSRAALGRRSTSRARGRSARA